MLTDNDIINWEYDIVRYTTKYKGVSYAIYDDNGMVQCGAIKVGVSYNMLNSIKVQYKRKNDKELESILCNMKDTVKNRVTIKSITKRYIKT